MNIAAPHPHHRVLFLSDLHLGALGCRADLLLAFLQANRAETYYLVGDVLDLWAPLLPHWTAAHQSVLDHLRLRQDQGARLVYLPGNHDPDPQAAPADRQVPGLSPCAVVHQAGDGRRFLVTHGDVIDSRLMRSHTATRIGSRLDHMLRRLDRGLRRNPDRRSAIQMLIASVNAALSHGRSHERRLVALARAQGLDGVICGHFHLAALHDDHGLTYANCGDWVDSFTALAEGADGRLRLLASPAAQPSRRALAMNSSTAAT